MFDREVDKLRSNRDKVTGFLRDQQRWLADFKTDLDHGLVPAVRASNIGAAAAIGGGINFYPPSRLGGISDNSLVGLRNNLSDLIK